MVREGWGLARVKVCKGKVPAGGLAGSPATRSVHGRASMRCWGPGRSMQRRMLCTPDSRAKPSQAEPSRAEPIPARPCGLAWLQGKARTSRPNSRYLSYTAFNPL